MSCLPMHAVTEHQIMISSLMSPRPENGRSGEGAPLWLVINVTVAGEAPLLFLDVAFLAKMEGMTYVAFGAGGRSCSMTRSIPLQITKHASLG